MTPGELIRATRCEVGLSQRQLAFRAGTTQAAVSRIESGRVSPSFATLRELMHAMGREPELSGRQIASEWDPAHLRATRERTPEECLRLAIGWNRLAARLTAAGQEARAGA